MFRTNEYMLLLWWLFHMPLMSETEIVLATPFERSPVQTLIKHCLDRGWVGVLKDGRARAIKSRYFLLYSGIQEVTRHFGMVPQWQVTERGLLEIRGYLQALEATYEIITRLFQSSAISLPWVLPLDPSDDPVLLRLDRDTLLTRFHWIKVHKKGFRPLAVAEYTTGDGHRLWLPVWYFGKNFERGKSPLDIRGIRQSLITAPDPWYLNELASPIGAIAITADHSSAWRVRSEVFPSHRVSLVTVKGDLVAQLEPGTPSGTFTRTTDRPFALGFPDNIVEGVSRLGNLLNEPERSEETTKETGIYRRHHALKGVVNTYLSEIVEDFPSIPRHEPEKRAGRLTGALRKNFEILTDADIIREIDGGLYMGSEGLTSSDDRDRVPEGTIHGDYSTYIKPNSGHRQSQQWHDRALVKVHSRLDEIGVYSVQGRRLNIAYKTNKAETDANSTTLKPDLWVAVPTRDGVIVWHALELDRSVYSVTTRQRKHAHCSEQNSTAIRSHICLSETGTPAEIGAQSSALRQCD